MSDMHIYTIPIWDAYHQQDECPFCVLSANFETHCLDAALGGGMMESDIRIKTNAEGFCAAHLQKLYAMQSALPLALMLHTHLHDVIGDLEKGLEALEVSIAAEEDAPAPARMLKNLSKGSDVKFASGNLAAIAQARTGSCYICSRVEDTMERYAKALIHMWKEETPFREAFSASKGLCLIHMPAVLEASSALPGGARRDFLRTLLNLQRDNFRRVEQELEWFTQKFDYRNADKPWHNSKDAVPRAMRRLRGPA